MQCMGHVQLPVSSRRVVALLLVVALQGSLRPATERLATHESRPVCLTQVAELCAVACVKNLGPFLKEWESACCSRQAKLWRSRIVSDLLISVECSVKYWSEF